ncbi:MULTISPECIES: response regulator [Streptomyces]|uniref:response regulator n=1 Tax=Streptomyces TaxID=1883 RepID=UPI0007C4BC51|nr:MULTISPECIES: response regulator transcription factor [Streptomyces]
MTIRVLLADDQPLVCAGLRMVVDATPGLAVVGEAATGTQAVALARELAPDVVVMDIRMPGMDGIEATRMITVESLNVRFVVLTTFDTDTHVHASLRAGASGFLVKDTDLDGFLTALRVVAAGDALIAPAVTRRLIAEFAGRPGPAHAPPAPELVGLTAREHEVLALVGRGLSNAELADHLGIGPGTVKTHVRNLLTKLGARDRVHLVIAAYEAGLATPARRPPDAAPGRCERYAHAPHNP